VAQRPRRTCDAVDDSNVRDRTGVGVSDSSSNGNKHAHAHNHTLAYNVLPVRSLPLLPPFWLLRPGGRVRVITKFCVWVPILKKGPSFEKSKNRRRATSD
jgi:hypothetical protein